MYFYFLFMVFLSVGESNARVVPLDFKINKCKHRDSNFLKNPVKDESLRHEVKNLDHGVHDTEKSNDLNLSNFEKNITTVLEVPNRNASNLSANLINKRKDIDEELKLDSAESSELFDVPDGLKSVSEFIPKDMDEESKLDSAESSELSDDPDDDEEEEFESVSEFISKNNLDLKHSFETLQVNENMNNQTSDYLTIKNETSMTNNSSSHNLEDRNNFMNNEDKNLNDAFNQNYTIAASQVISDQNETIAASQVISDQNETIAASQVISDQNETIADFEKFNSTNRSSSNFSEVQSLSDETKVEESLSETKNIASDLNIAHDSVKAAGGILSGFEFLINSEVARNAARAMEVFNFSDPLTDHIIEENEFHSFLPAFNAGQSLDSSNKTDSKTEIIIINSGESNETQSDFNKSLPFEDATSLVHDKPNPEEIEKDFFQPFNSSELLEVRNKTELTDFVEKFEGNAILDSISPLENSKENIKPGSEVTPSEQINTSVAVSSIANIPECPPPGLCIFWFLSQDTCAINEHCLGSRICCKIRCSKTCIEVESL